jgi:hypothetical protein
MADVVVVFDESTTNEIIVSGGLLDCETPIHGRVNRSRRSII